MRAREDVDRACGGQGRRTQFQFLQQVRSLELQLTRGDRHPFGFRSRVDPGTIEPITAPLGFREHAPEIGADGGRGFRMGAESVQLRMMPVSPCDASEHALGEQGFAPERNEAPGIEIRRM